PIAVREQPGGKRLARAAPTGVVVVVVDAEREGSPPRYLTAHLDPLELDPAEEVEQRPLFVGHEEVPLIREACGLLGHDRSIIRRSPGRGFRSCLAYRCRSCFWPWYCSLCLQSLVPRLHAHGARRLPATTSRIRSAAARFRPTCRSASSE